MKLKEPAAEPDKHHHDASSLPLPERRSSISSIVRRLFSLLPTPQRRRFPFLLAGMVTLAVTEMLALAAIALFVTSLGNPAATLSGPVLGLLRRLTGKALDVKPVELILGVSVAVVATLAVRNVVAIVVRYSCARYSAGIQAYVGTELFGRFLRAPYEWHLGRNSAQLVQALDWRAHFGTLVQRLLEGLTDLLVLVAIMAALVLQQTVVGLLVSGLLGGLALLVYRRVRRVLRRTSVEVRSLTRTGFDEASSALQGIKEVRLSSAEGLFLGRLRSVVEDLIPRLARQRILETAPGWILETAGFVLLAAAITVLVVVLRQPFATVFATIGTLAVAAWRALPTLNRVVTSGAQIRFALPFVESVLDYLRDTPVGPSRADSDAHSALTFRGSMELDRVTYRYPEGNRPALCDVSFEVHRGSVVGLIGSSGAGKSTCADLMAGLLTPTQGSVLVDGQSLRPEDAFRWLRSVGYVTQHPYLLDASLAENIAVGKEPGSIDEARLLRCCELASVDFLTELPDGIWTRLGERGTRLSGGQRQRVAIARVLYRDPELIILDEATSALDDRSERAIRRAIRSLRGRFTVLIIAHRLSSVEDCDEVIWLDAGRLRELGPAGTVLASYVARDAES